LWRAINIYSAPGSGSGATATSHIIVIDFLSWPRKSSQLNILWSSAGVETLKDSKKHKGCNPRPVSPEPYVTWTLVLSLLCNVNLFSRLPLQQQLQHGPTIGGSEVHPGPAVLELSREACALRL
jgi:hypothetical protein